MSDIAQDLGGVVRLLVPEPKPMPDLLLATYHEARGWNACRDAMLKLISTHSAEIAGALRDAERYRWLREQASWWMVSTPDAAKLSVMLPRASIDAAIGTEGCDFDTAIDSAMQQGGGGGDHG